MVALVGIDLGLRTCLALYGETGRLLWYRSLHFGTATQLRGAIFAILKELPGLRWLVLEGGNAYGDIWHHEAARRGVEGLQIDAKVWCGQLLYVREQQSGPDAKEYAGDLARRAIAWSGAAQKPLQLQPSQWCWLPHAHYGEDDKVPVACWRSGKWNTRKSGSSPAISAMRRRPKPAIASACASIQPTAMRKLASSCAKGATSNA